MATEKSELVELELLASWGGNWTTSRCILQILNPFISALLDAGLNGSLLIEPNMCKNARASEDQHMYGISTCVRLV